jgi:putative PIN family toxin of toxin-antitoxin system
VRLVLATNTVLSAVLWRGAPYRLPEATRNLHPRVQIYSSPVLLDELAEVLARAAFSQRLSAIGKTIREVLANYIELIDLVEPMEVPQVARDPDDNHVLACAIAAKAELIVSGDKDLLDLAQYQDILILTTADTLRRIEATKP